MEKNQKLQEIFQLTDSKKITDVFISEMGIIIKTLAPSKWIQLNKKNRTKLSREAIETVNEADKLLNTATNTLNNNSFRAAKAMQH